MSISSPQDLVTLREDAANKEKKGRNQLNKSGDTVPLDFVEALEDVLVNDLGALEANKSGGFVGPVLKAKFQADAAIIGQFDRDEIILAITNESDMPIIGGDKFLANKDYTKDVKYALVSTCKATLTNTMRHLPEKSREMPII